jgi:hypothetical protein
MEQFFICNFLIILFSNLLNLNVPDEGRKINWNNLLHATFYLFGFPPFDFERT